MKRVLQEYYWLLIIFALWRAGLFVVGALSGYFLPFKPSFPYGDTLLAVGGRPEWLWSWGNFDGVHYLTLAKIGYDGFGTQVFFPLYPLLISVLGRIILDPLVAGLLISNLAILVAAAVLYKLVKKTAGETAARWAVIFLFAFPTSFYFGAVYTEALFLLLVLGAFSAPGRLAGVAAGLAGGARLAGAFLAPALITGRNRWGVLGVLGGLGYAAYLGWRFGRPLFFLSAQEAFGHSRAAAVSGLVTPFQVVYRYGRIFLTASPAHYDFWVAVLEAGAFAFGVGVLMWLTVKRKVPLPWLVFSWLALLLPTFSGTFSSLPRYLLPLFPIFAGLGMIKSKPVKLVLLVLFVSLLTILTALFTRGYWVA